MAEARGYLEFSCRVYQAQYRAGRVFLHEHPSSASSWEEQSITKLMELPGIEKYQLDMCRYGLKPDGDNLIKKAYYHYHQLKDFR